MSKKISQLLEVAALEDNDFVTGIDASQVDPALQNVKLTRAALLQGVAPQSAVDTVAGDLLSHEAATGDTAHAGMLLQADLDNHKAGVSQHTIAGVTNLQAQLNLKANAAELGDAATRDVGTASTDVAAGDRPQVVMDNHLSAFVHANLPTSAQKGAMTNAALPSSSNPFATMSDIDMEGINLKSTGQAAQRILVTDGGGNFIYEAKPAGGETTTFKDLTDTPSSYLSQAGKAVRVKVDETGLEFYPAEGIEDAPVDGEFYARRNAAWAVSPVSPVGAISTHYVMDAGTAEVSPAAGHVALNNADQTLATKMFVNAESRLANDVALVWSSLQAGDYVGFWEEGTDRSSLVFKLTGPVTNNSTWFSIPVVYVPGGAGSIGATQNVTLSTAVSPANRLPVGGTNNQVLAKNDAGDYAISWLTLGGAAFLNVGTAAGTVAAGNDSRFSDARTPTAHAGSHASGGSDQITPFAIGAATAAQGAKADTAVQPARSVLTGTGLTGGGNLSADRTLAAVFGTTAGTVAQGNDSRLSDARTPTAHAASHATGQADAISPASIGAATAAQGAKADSAVQPSRTISAGAGLTGGGDLSANRTLSANFGTTAGTVAQGNDSRLSDSRTPTAHAASHASGQADALALSALAAPTAAVPFNNQALTGIKTATFYAEANLAATSGSINIDWSAAQNHKQAEPTGAITYTFTAPPGPGHLQLRILSDGTSTAQTITWPAAVKWFGALWAGVDNKAAVINFWYDGTNYWAMGANEV